MERSDFEYRNVVSYLKKIKAGEFSALLLVLVLFVYGGTSIFPFIQDDWGVIHSLRERGVVGYIVTTISNTNEVFYLPISACYMAIVYSILGMNSSGFHIIALFIHFVNSLLLVLIVDKLLHKPVIAWTVGFLYALAAAIHLDTLLWMVGADRSKTLLKARKGQWREVIIRMTNLLLHGLLFIKMVGAKCFFGNLIHSPLHFS